MGSLHFDNYVDWSFTNKRSIL